MTENQQDQRISRIVAQWESLGLTEGFEGEFEYRAKARVAKEDAINAARGGTSEEFEAALKAADSDDSDLPYGLRGRELRYGQPREPWLLHGLEINRQWLTPEAAMVYEHRLEVSDALYEAGHVGTADGGGRLLFPGFSARDREDWTSWRPFEISQTLDYDAVVRHLTSLTEQKGAKDALAQVEAMIEEGQTGIVDRRKEARFNTVLDTIQGMHDDHWFYAHPFCRDCFPSDYVTVDGYYAAWLLKQRTDTAFPSYEWDGQVPPMPVVQDEIRFLTDADLDAMPEPTWLIEGVLPDHGTGILRARDQSFKSFMALSWALQVVVDGGKVLYCVGEGSQEFGRRRDAWLEHNGYDVDDIEGRLHYTDRVPNLFTGGSSFDLVLNAVRREQYDLVIIDTYARAAAGSDINSQGDQSIVTARVDEIKRACDGTVLLVAHSQKSDTDSSGSIEIEDARDFVFSMKRKGTEGRVTFEITKQKDGVESPRPVEYVIKQVARSIVLVEAGEEGPSLMTEKDWVVAALHNTEGLGPRSMAEIRGWINSQENRDKPIKDATLTSTVSRMVQTGQVVKTGQKYSLAKGFTHSTETTPEA